MSHFSNVMLEEAEEVILEPFVINRNSYEFITKDYTAGKIRGINVPYNSHRNSAHSLFTGNFFVE